LFTRTRFQQGSLQLKKRADGEHMWEFRWYEPTEKGKRSRKVMFIGTSHKYKSRSAAQKSPEVQAVLFRINGDHPKAETAVPTIGAIVARYKQEELPKRYATRAMYLSLLKNHVLPKWEAVTVREITPLAVEKWLQSLELAPKTKTHIRGLMHLLFQCARRWQWTDVNPMALVRVKGGTKRLTKRRVLTASEFHALLEQMTEPYRTMVLIAGCLGLRVCEIAALQWGDFDFADSRVLVQRSIVHGHVGEAKTEYSHDYVPLDQRLAEAILEHHQRSYETAEGWLFANPKTSKPYRPDGIQKKHLYKIGVSLGLGEGIGWHTFRHTYRTWLDETGASMKVQQELMRHADISTTMNVYGAAMIATKRQANSKVVTMAIGGMEPVMGVYGSASETAKAG
jgi:integrase